MLKGPLGLTRGRHLPPPRPRLRPPTTRTAIDLVTSGEYDLGVLPAADPGDAGQRRRRGGREHAAEVHVLLPEGPHRDCCSTRWMIRADASYHRRTMRASAPRVQAFRHDRQGAATTAWRSTSQGTRAATTPGPARRSCSPRASPPAPPITMEMYAERKGWDIGDLEVDCEYTPAERGCPTRFELVLRFPAGLSDEQVESLQGHRREVPGPPDARRRGHVRRARRARRPGVLLSARADLAGASAPSCSTPTRRSASTSTAAPTPPSSSRSTSTTATLHAVFTRRPRRPAPARGRDLVPRRAPGRRGRRTCATTALREAEEEIGLPPRRASSCVGALQADADDRDELRDLSLRRPHRARPASGSSRRARSRRSSSSSLTDAARGLRPPAARAPRHPVPHRRLHRRRGAHLGRDRPDARPTCSSASAPSRCPASCARPARRRGCPTRSTSRRSS